MATRVAIRKEGQVVGYVTLREIEDVASTDTEFRYPLRYGERDMVCISLKRGRSEGRWFVVYSDELLTLLPKRWRPV